LIKNSQPFGKNFQKTLGGGFFFDSHCISSYILEMVQANAKVTIERDYLSKGAILNDLELTITQISRSRYLSKAYI